MPGFGVSPKMLTPFDFLSLDGGYMSIHFILIVYMYFMHIKRKKKYTAGKYK